MNAQTIENKNNETYSINPKKFVLWLFIVGIVMLFAAFTSAYIVRRAEGNWLDFQLPTQFLYNTIIVVLSSITLQWAYIAAKRDELTQIKVALASTLLLGIGFVIGQYYAWEALVAQKVYLVGNPSGSFVIVISFVHLLHIIGGLIFLLVMLVQASKFKVHKKNLLNLNLCLTYWHFIGVLWVYLYIFFLVNR